MTQFKSLQIATAGFFLGFFALISNCRAETALGSISAGALIGASFVSSTTQFTVGAEGIYEVAPPFGLGLSLTYYSVGTNTPGVTGTPVVSYSSSFTTITAQGWYFLSDYVPGLRAGAQLGLGISTTNFPGASGSTNMVIGPSAGYDYKFIPQFSAGAETTLYFNTASGSSADFQLLAALKYWF
jgi:hypothetical protein